MSDQTTTTSVTDVLAQPEIRASECLVVIYAREREAGQCIKLGDTRISIGRGTGNEVQLDDHGASRRHARVERLEGRTILQDVGSKNGTLLNGLELEGTAVLSSGDLIKVGSTIFKYLCAKDLEAALHEQIYQNTITDYLTQLHNKRHFDDALAREFSRSRRHARPLSMLLIDIDHFKRVNDKYGHYLGDLALSGTAAKVRSCVRSEDVPARVGGEELAVLLPETSLEDAETMAETIRASVEQNQISHREQSLVVTVSIGCAQYDTNDADVAAFLQRCDAALYAAKHAGRNRVQSA